VKKEERKSGVQTKKKAELKKKRRRWGNAYSYPAGARKGKKGHDHRGTESAIEKGGEKAEGGGA